MEMMAVVGWKTTWSRQAEVGVEEEEAWIVTSHDKGLRTPKSPSPSEELNSRILKDYYGVKESDNTGSPHIKPKAHAEEEVMAEDE